MPSTVWLFAKRDVDLLRQVAGVLVEAVTEAEGWSSRSRQGRANRAID